MRSRERERGSALLIVFLFAAFVAIMLYEEMPVMAFEAQRAREQLLIDRGNQYKQAVKVYWTHFQGRFPPDINALESTNNIRFLRQRYKDPLTGKDNWRLLHMAPGGMGLIDSKVNPLPLNTNQNAQNGQSGAANANSTSSAFGGSGFGGTGFSGSGTGFGAQSSQNNNNSISGPVGAFTGSNSASGGPNGPEPNNVGGPPVYSVPQRPPALAATGSPGASGGDPNDPNSLNNSNYPNGGGVQNPGMSAFLNPQQSPNGPAMTTPGQYGGQSPNQASPNQPPNAVQQIYGMLSNQGAPAQTGMPGGAFNQQAPSSTTGTSAFGSNTGTSTFGSNNGANTTLGGMFAGVASIAQGHGIKVINDQHDYSKWEFWFNPQEANAAGGAAGAQSTSAPAQNGAANQSNGFGFGTGSAQGAGQTSGTTMTGGVFGNNGNNNTTTAAPPIGQPQQ